MKINFDELQNQLKKSLNTTEGSVIFSSNTLTNYGQHPTKTLMSNSNIAPLSGYQRQHKYKTSNQPIQSYQKQFTVSQLQKQQNWTISQSHKPKGPRKFGNVKTLEEMQDFIQTMNSFEVDEAGQNQSKENTDNYTYFNQKYGCITNKKKGQNYMGLYKKKIIINKYHELAKHQCPSRDKPVERTYSKQQVESLNKRLYYQSQHRKDSNTNADCKRKACKEIISTRQRKQRDDSQNYTGQPRPMRCKQHNSDRAKRHHSLQNCLETPLTSSIYLSLKQKEQLHERLYNDSKQRQKRREILQQQIHERQLQELNQKLTCNLRSHSYSNQAYTKNYQGFYQRLDELVDRQQRKYQLFQKLDLSAFAPGFYGSNQKPTASKYKQQRESLQSTFSTCNKKRVLFSKKCRDGSKKKCKENSTQSLQRTKEKHRLFELNPVSARIVHQHQAEFIQKIKLMFFDRKSKKVRIDSQRISNLSQKEFEIMFGLITKMQQKIEEFKTQKKIEKQIVKFYLNLDTAQRQELRRIEILNTYRNRQSRNKQQRDQRGKNKANYNLDKSVQSLKRGTGIKNSIGRQSESKLNSALNRSREKELSDNKAKGKVMSGSMISDQKRDYCQKLAEFV